MSNSKTNEIYAEIQQRFLDALSKGVAPWQKPWVGELSAPRNLQSGKTYRGINALLLGLSGYADPRWTTFAAAKKMGGKVRKGEKSTLVTLWKRLKVKDQSAPNGEKVIAMLRYFRVFNVEQVEWPEGAIRPLKQTEQSEGWDGHEEAERVIESYRQSPNAPSISYGGDSASYYPLLHLIRLPVPGDFWHAWGFYGTAFHECAHSTGHRSLLNRELSNGFGSERYAKEELVAEMASAFICATLGIEGGFDNSAAYLKGWAQRIADDPKLIVQAAGLAQKAADRILGVSFNEPESTVENIPTEAATVAA